LSPPSSINVFSLTEAESVVEELFSTCGLVESLQENSKIVVRKKNAFFM
jgi:hypothetical protein